MAKFMLFLYGSPANRQPAPADALKVTQEYMAWGQKLGAEGKLEGGEKLTYDAGKVLRPSGAAATVTDGPFAESKELIGGYFCIVAPNYDAAVALARTCPHLKFGGGIEVRQIEEMHRA